MPDLPDFSAKLRGTRLRARTLSVLDQAKETQLEFLRAELDIGMAHAGRALSTRNVETRERAQSNARHAYDTFVRGLEKSSLAPAEAEEVLAKLEKLRSRLRELGENV